MSISYGRQFIDDEDISAVVQALKSDFLTQGPAVRNFEQKICEITGAKYCVAVSNATAGLHIAVAALKPAEGEEGITSPNTFLASSNCLIYNNMKPVFADIDPETYNIDPNEIEKKISKKTKVVIPVHFAGLPCDMRRIKEIADKNNIFVIEDAAHAIGSRYFDGTPVGNCRYSDMTVFSFHPVKTITTGEGGAITTNNLEIYKSLQKLRSHGTTKDINELTINPGPWYYEMQELGFNYRLTDMQAALGLSQLNKLERFKERRREIISKYNVEFQGIDWLKIPVEPKGLNSCFHLYVVQIDFKKLGLDRKAVMHKLLNQNVGTQVHYIPVHTQPYYREKFYYRIGDFPKVEAYYEKALSLPLFPAMNNDDIYMVIKAIKGLDE